MVRILKGKRGLNTNEHRGRAYELKSRSGHYEEVTPTTRISLDSPRAPPPRPPLPDRRGSSGGSALIARRVRRRGECPLECSTRQSPLPERCRGISRAH